MNIVHERHHAFSQQAQSSPFCFPKPVFYLRSQLPSKGTAWVGQSPCPGHGRSGRTGCACLSLSLCPEVVGINMDGCLRQRGWWQETLASTLKRLSSVIGTISRPALSFTSWVSLWVPSSPGTLVGGPLTPPPSLTPVCLFTLLLQTATKSFSTEPSLQQEHPIWAQAPPTSSRSTSCFLRLQHPPSKHRQAGRRA